MEKRETRSCRKRVGYNEWLWTLAEKERERWSHLEESSSSAHTWEKRDKKSVAALRHCSVITKMISVAHLHYLGLGLGTDAVRVQTVVGWNYYVLLYDCFCRSRVYTPALSLRHNNTSAFTRLCDSRHRKSRNKSTVIGTSVRGKRVTQTDPATYTEIQESFRV